MGTMSSDMSETSATISLLRRLWVRLIIVVVLTCAALFCATFSDHHVLRDTLASVLPSTLFIFGIMTGLITYLMSNHVRGIYSAGVAAIGRARDSIWQYRDQYRNHSSPAIQEIYDLNLLKLVSRQQLDWFEPNNIRGWDVGLVSRLKKIDDARTRIELFSRYLMPVHEAVEELTTLYVRSVIANIQIRHVFGSFALLTLAIVVNIIMRVIPYGFRLDLCVIGMIGATLTFTLLELLLLFDFVSSEVSNEMSSFHRASAAWVNAEDDDEEESPDEVLDEALSPKDPGAKR